LLPGADRLVFVDLRDTVRQTYRYAKQDAGRGCTEVKGLNALLVVVSTPLSAPLIAATWLRRGSTKSARGAAKLLTDALATARRAGAAASPDKGRSGPVLSYRWPSISFRRPRQTEYP
jgi:hypothetical protein